MLSPPPSPRRLITVGLFRRDPYSTGNSRRIFGYEAFHWAIILMSESSKDKEKAAESETETPPCLILEATDRSEIDPETFRINNPTMDWFFSKKKTDIHSDPDISARLLGRLIVGEVGFGSDGVGVGGSDGEIADVLERDVSLPVKNTHPQQSCVSWTTDALRSLQGKGWVREFDLERFKDEALGYADEMVKGERSSRSDVKEYDG